MTNIEKAKIVAEEQWEEIAETCDDSKMIYFVFGEEGTRVVNPWVDLTGEKDFTDEEAIVYYGSENFIYFVEKVVYIIF